MTLENDTAAINNLFVGYVQFLFREQYGLSTDRHAVLAVQEQIRSLRGRFTVAWNSIPASEQPAPCVGGFHRSHSTNSCRRSFLQWPSSALVRLPGNLGKTKRVEYLVCEACVKYGAFLLSYTHAPRPQYGMHSSPDVACISLRVPITSSSEALKRIDSKLSEDNLWGLLGCRWESPM